MKGTSSKSTPTPKIKGRDHGILRYKVYLRLTVILVSESESTEAQSACFDDNSSGFACFDDNSSRSRGNMKIPSVSSVDCDMVSKSEKTKAEVACSEDKSEI
ncbi:hypothetical protein Tco_0165723 [Tanacetum coccineum]